MASLSKAQKAALEYLYNMESTTFTQWDNANKKKPYDKLVEYGYAKSAYISGKKPGDGYSTEYALTPAGEQLARALFDSTPDPEPTSEPIAETPVSDSPCNASRHFAYVWKNKYGYGWSILEAYKVSMYGCGGGDLFDTAEQAKQDIRERFEGVKILSQKAVRAEKECRATIFESQHGRPPYPNEWETIKASVVTPSSVVAESAQADPVASKPVSGVQWLTRDDLKVPEHRYFVQQMYPVVLNYELRFADINGHALQATSTGQIKAKRGSQVSSIMNMQKRATAKPTVAKREPLRETVLQIVSRIQTPLTSQTRRVA